MSPKEAMAAVRCVYAELAVRALPRACSGSADCCRFRLTGRTPYLTQGEAWVAAAGWRAAGRTGVQAPADGACPFLGATGRCQIYEDRPFGCRTHFCEPAGGPHARGHVRDLIQRLEAIDHHLGGRGAMNLPAALAQVMLAVARKNRN